MLRAVAILALVVTATSSQPPTPTPTKEAQVQQNLPSKVRTEPHKNQQTTGNASPALPQPSALVRTGNQPDRGNVKKDHPATSGWEIVGTIAGVFNTILLTLFSGALAVLAYRQWLAIDRQAKLMHRQAVVMRRQLASMQTTGDDTNRLASAAQSQIELLTKHVEAAKLAADSAHNSVLVALAQSNIAKLDQRAWVGVVSLMHTPLTSNRPFEVGVNIMNSGKTPAKGRTKMRARMLPEFVPPELAGAQWLPGGMQSHAIFFPNALGHTRNYVRSGVEMTTMTNGDVATLLTGFNKVFVDGRIDYVDVFGQPHWTEFRYVWNAFQDVFTQCSEGNSTDDEWTPLGEVAESTEDNDT